MYIYTCIHTETDRLFFFIKLNKAHMFANECMGNKSKPIKSLLHSQTIKSVLSVTFFSSNQLENFQDYQCLFLRLWRCIVWRGYSNIKLSHYKWRILTVKHKRLRHNHQIVIHFPFLFSFYISSVSNIILRRKVNFS